MAHTACLVCFISAVNDCSKKRESAFEDVALVADTQQNLGNLYSLDIYEIMNQAKLSKIKWWPI
jgi:hypothetical protein